MRRSITYMVLCVVISGCASTAGWRPAQPTITLKRATCLSFCPAYTITLEPSGAVKYAGEAYVREVGERRSIISREQYAALASEFRDFARFRESYASTEDGCGSTVTDLPSQTIVIRESDHVKRVYAYAGCMKGKVEKDVDAVFALGNSIDKAVDTQQWVGTRDERIPKPNSGGGKESR